MSSDIAVLPVIPLADAVVFPRAIASVSVFRPRGLAALEAALASEDKRAFFVLSKPTEPAAGTEGSAGRDDEKRFHLQGAVGEVLQHTRSREGAARVLVEGLSEGFALDARERGDWTEAMVETLDVQIEPPSREMSALRRAAATQFQTHCELLESAPEELVQSIVSLEDPLLFAYQAAAQSRLDPAEKQAILEEPILSGKLRRLLGSLRQENELKELENRILDQARSQIGQSQREYFLNEQLKIIERELGVDGEDSELEELERKLKELPVSDEARAKVERELRRLEKMPPVSPEATVARTYIDTVLDMPWGVYTEDDMDLSRAEAILDKDHYGLEKVKDRILEFLAVAQNVGEMRGPALCLVGPPGVGKTSLAKSVAKALGRKFARVSLGGVRDEAEIRGHRRTYIGSMPGKIVQGIRKAGSMNPVFLLDEIDKMSSDFRGDPSAALLEALDREHNKEFVDHYLEAEFDLSRVLFFATANYAGSIPPPLLDRMEVIRLAGYTEEEKVKIGARHLFPKQRREHGLKKADLSLSESAARYVVNGWTREAGVRELERHLAKLCRKSIRERLSEGKETAGGRALTRARVRELLGPERHKDSFSGKSPEAGVAIGLAWTEAGGELLPVESLVMPGQGKLGLTLTGKLGEVMQESARASLAYIRANWEKLGVDRGFYLERDLHLHVPEGAIPKDGPSAGVAMLCSMVSALSGLPARQDVAMTGEITLRGSVLRVGGLKEKALAARRYGIKEVVVPADNMDDLEDIPQSVREAMTFHPVKTVDEAIRVVFGGAAPRRPRKRAEGKAKRPSAGPLSAPKAKRRAPASDRPAPLASSS